MNVFQIILLVVTALVLAGLFAYLIRIVPQAKAYVIERLGTYHITWNMEIHALVPFVDCVSNKVILKEVVKNFTPQPIITKGNVTTQTDTVIYFQITGPELHTYSVVGPVTAIKNLTVTALHNIIGDLELDETLTSRDIINTKMCAILDETTDPWGIKVNRVEAKDIIPPRDIQEVMGRQMRAERERRKSILRAGGERRSNILTAENEKEAMVLCVSVKKEAMITEAEGQARAAGRIYEAQARDIEMIKNANPTREYLSLKGLETYEEVADSKAIETVVPSEVQSMASSLTSAREILIDDAAKDTLEEVIKPKKGRVKHTKYLSTDVFHEKQEKTPVFFRSS